MNSLFRGFIYTAHGAIFDLFTVFCCKICICTPYERAVLQRCNLITRGGGGGGTWVNFWWVCALTSQNPYPIIVYSVASYRPHLSHFWANVIVISRTEFNASRLLNIKTIAGAIFQPRIFLFLNLCLPEFSYPINPENLRRHSRNSTKNVIPL